MRIAQNMDHLRASDYDKAKEAFEIVCGHFNGNVHKANFWLNAYNPRLGTTPATLMKTGRMDKLLKWIRDNIGKHNDETSHFTNRSPFKTTASS